MKVLGWILIIIVAYAILFKLKYKVYPNWNDLDPASGRGLLIKY